MNTELVALRERRTSIIHNLRELYDRDEREGLDEEEIAYFKEQVNEIRRIDARIEIVRRKMVVDDLAEVGLELMECPGCEKEIKSSANFCGYCGIQVNDQIVKCICGHINDISNLFCTNCGNALSKK